MPDLASSLLNPNQLRHFAIEVQDSPCHRDPVITQKDDDDNIDSVAACLELQGTNVHFDTWTPMDADLQQFPNVQLTSSTVWNPNDIKLPGLSDVDIQETESWNVSSVDLNSRGVMDAPHGNPCS